MTRSDDRKLKLGISACLLGEKVRYDGGHKLNHYLTDVLGPFVEWVPVCPEKECGLPVPREAMHLTGDPQNPRLVTVNTGIDHTDRMLHWAGRKLEKLAQENLCGFVFKAKSPSSGMRDIKVYNDRGMPARKGTGLFAGLFMQRFPLVPVEDEGRLNDAGLRENFINRIFVMHRWQVMLQSGKSARNLVAFHTRHKLLMMAHSPKMLGALGRLTAGAGPHPSDAVITDYLSQLMAALKQSATIRKNVNVLQHITGYFKKQLSPDEKQELLEIIGRYHEGLIPLIVPVTLLNHYVRKYQETYLMNQYYLNPHPAELMLRNHV